MKTLQEIVQLSIAKKIYIKSVCHVTLEQIRIPKMLKRGIICEYIKCLLFKCQLCGHGDGKMIIHFHLHRERTAGVDQRKKYCSLCYNCYQQAENRGISTYITVGPLDKMVTEKNFSKFIKCKYCTQNYVRLIDGFHWHCFNCHRINIWSQLTRDNNMIFQYTQDTSLTSPLYKITIDVDRFEKFKLINTKESLYMLLGLHMTQRYRENIVYIINGLEFRDDSYDHLTVNDILPYGIKNISELMLYDEDIIEIKINIKIFILKNKFPEI